jgi:hypothetical protein
VTKSFLAKEARCSGVSPDPQTCIAEAQKVEELSLDDAYGTTTTKIEKLVLYVILALLGAYVVTLCARTLGWIALGFTRPAQS